MTIITLQAMIIGYHYFTTALSIILINLHKLFEHFAFVRGFYGAFIREDFVRRGF